MPGKYFKTRMNYYLLSIAHTLTKFAKVRFLQVSVHGGGGGEGAWQGGMHGWGMHGRGCAWRRHAWWVGGMHGRGACMVVGGHV